MSSKSTTPQQDRCALCATNVFSVEYVDRQHWHCKCPGIATDHGGVAGSSWRSYHWGFETSCKRCKTAKSDMPFFTPKLYPPNEGNELAAQVARDNIAGVCHRCDDSIYFQHAPNHWHCRCGGARACRRFHWVSEQKCNADCGEKQPEERFVFRGSQAPVVKFSPTAATSRECTPPSYRPRPPCTCRVHNGPPACEACSWTWTFYG